jgi:AbrB family looped-hinge helix DNA binding protein
MPLVAVKTKYQVTIPQELRERLDIAEGDLLEADVKNGKLVFTPKSVIDRDPRIDAALDIALKEVKQGKTVGPFDSVEDMKGSLKRKPRKAA